MVPLFLPPPSDITTARKLLGSDKIVGISANTVDEAVTACDQGADYLGIGTVFSTQTFVLSPPFLFLPFPRLPSRQSRCFCRG